MQTDGLQKITNQKEVVGELVMREKKTHCVNVGTDINKLVEK